VTPPDWKSLGTFFSKEISPFAPRILQGLGGGEKPGLKEKGSCGKKKGGNRGGVQGESF